MICYSLDRESSNEINSKYLELGSTNMKMQDETKSLTFSSKQQVNPVLFVACLAVGAIAIFASASLYPGFVQGQESGETGVEAVQNATNMSSSVSNQLIGGF